MAAQVRIGRIVASTQRPATGAAYQRGVNSAGADFGANPRSPANGTYDSDASFAFYATRGHKKVRVPFLMERLLPALGGALNTTELNALTAAVNSCTSRGMTAVLDPHNYARYQTADGVTHVLGDADGVFTQALFADFWTKLSTAFRNRSLVEYGLMNEPHDLTAQVNPGTDILGGAGGFEDGTVGGFTAGTNSSVANSTTQAYAGTHSLAVTAVAAGSTQASHTFAATAGTAYTVTMQARAAATTRQTFSQINWFSSTGAYLSTANGVFANDSTTGWTSLAAVITAPTGATSGAVVCGVNGTPTAGETHYFDGITVSIGTSLPAAQVWERAAQAAVTAIRNNSDNTWIWVPGVAYAGAQNWWANHPTWWINDSAGKSGPEAHYYFDSDNSGTYVNTYSSDNTDAVNKGYANLTAKAQAELGRFTDGCASRNVKGFLGEIGWPNTTTTYNAVGDACYALLDSKALDVTYWAAGEQWGTTYLLSIYTGTPQVTLTSVAATVEAHPSTATAGGATGTARVRIGRIAAAVTSPYAARVRIGRVVATVQRPATVARVRVGRIAAAVTATTSGTSLGLIRRSGAWARLSGSRVWKAGAPVAVSPRVRSGGAWKLLNPPAPTPTPVAGMPPAVAGFTLVAADNFSSIDPGSWYVYDNSTFGAPSRVQRYMARNAVVGAASDGVGSSLQLGSKREAVGGNAFTAAMLDSQTVGKYYPRYPRMEARMKIPHGQGLWPAWWLTAKNGGANTVEVDIMESFHSQIPGKTLTTLHRTNNAGTVQYNVAKNTGGTFFEKPTYTPGWQTIAIEIYPVTDSTGTTGADPAQPSSFVRFKAYLNGTKYWDYVDTQALYWTTNGGNADSFFNVYLQGCQIDGNYVGAPDDPLGYSHWLNQCISGGGTPPNACQVVVGGYSIIRAQFPSAFELDYHRVWKYTG